MPPRRRKTDRELTLRAWTGFASQGRVRIAFGAGKRPSAEQEAAVEYLRANDRAIANAATGRVLTEYPRLRREHNATVDDDDDDEVTAFERSIGIGSGGGRRLPSIRTRAGLRDVMSLACVHVLDVARDGIAYVGFQLACEWDEEHGGGVLVHRKRVVAFGHADVSFTEWRATDDAA